MQAKYVKIDENEMRDEAGAFESFCATSFAGDVSVKKRLLLEQMGYVLFFLGNAVRKKQDVESIKKSIRGVQIRR